MDRQQYRSSSLQLSVKNLQNPLSLLAILCRKWLIQKQQRGTPTKGTQEFSSLGFSTGELVRTAAAERVGGKLHEAEQK